MTFPYHRLIRASAGSGKTYALTTRYIGLILCGESPDSILAVTFTRSAAGEIMERILERLLAALETKGLLDLTAALQSEGFTDLADSLQSVSPEEARDQWVLPALSNLLSQLHKSQVSTLDAFFSKIATGFTYECDLAPGWKILDEEILAKVRSGAIQKILGVQGSQGARQLMHRLNKGSLGSQVAADLERWVNQFHDKWREYPLSAWELPSIFQGPGKNTLDRVLAELEEYRCPEKKTGGPLKTWEDSLLKLRLAWGEDLPKKLEVCKTGLVAKVLSGDLSFNRREIPDDLCQLIGVFLDQIRSEYCTLIRAQNAATGNLLEQYDQFRSQGLKEQGGLNYGDVPVALLNARIFGQPGLIDDRMDASVRHMLLDEFQDTSFIQFAVLAPLIDELAADSSDGRTLFCVGDSKQAIYGWRGGRAEVMDLFAEKLLPDSEIRFDESWRSSDPVISTVNQTFSNMSALAPKPGDQSSVDNWASLFDKHKVAAPIEPKPEGHVTLRIAQEYADKSSKVWPYLDTLEEVERLQRLSPKGSIAILVRKNQQISHLVDALKSRGIEASEERGNPLTDSPAVGRLLALLEAIEHPGDATMKLAVERSPLPQILGWNGDQPWEEVISDLRKQVFTKGVTEVFGPICDSLSSLCAMEDQVRIGQLMEQLRTIGFHGLRLADLIQGLRQRSVPRPGGSPVQVMTIHQAKGLEFDAVILPELAFRWFSPTPDLLSLEENHQPLHLSRYVGEKQLNLVGDPYPQMHQQSRNQRLSETLCLLYVAMTRAKHTLTMLLPPPGESGEYPDASYASLLVSQLGPDVERVPGQTLYQCGSPGDYSDESGSVIKRSVAVERKLASDSPVDSPAIASKRASHLTEERRLALRKGELIHTLLENCHWDMIDKKQAESILKAEFPRDVQLYSAVISDLIHARDCDQFRNLFDLHESRQRLGYEDSDDLLLEVEVPILSRIAGREFHGVIDRLILRRSGDRVTSAEIVDFKTDISASDASELLDRYQSQLETYCTAVCEGWGISVDDIDLRIAHVNSGTVSSMTISR